MALRLFSQKGFADTSVREIVNGAGVTAPTLYYYFNNKEGVYVHLLEQASHDFQDAMAGAANEGDGMAEQLLAVTRAQLAFARAHPDEMRFLLGALHGHRGQTGFVDAEELRRRCLAPCEKLLTDGMSDASRARDVALAYAGIVHAWIEAMLDGRRDASGCEDMVRTLLAS